MKLIKLASLSRTRRGGRRNESFMRKDDKLISSFAKEEDRQKRLLMKNIDKMKYYFNAKEP